MPSSEQDAPRLPTNATPSKAGQDSTGGQKSPTRGDQAETVSTGANSVAPPQQIESYSYDPEGNRIASHISASYAVDVADRVLENADNRYDWSADGQLTKRTPKAGGVAWSFVSSFRARTNQMRLDAALGSDGTTIGFVYDPFGRLVSPQWPAPRGNEELYYDGPDVVLGAAASRRRRPMGALCPWAAGRSASRWRRKSMRRARRRRRGRDRNSTIMRMAKARSA